MDKTHTHTQSHSDRHTDTHTLTPTTTHPPKHIQVFLNMCILWTSIKLLLPLIENVKTVCSTGRKKRQWLKSQLGRSKLKIKTKFSTLVLFRCLKRAELIYYFRVCARVRVCALLVHALYFSSPRLAYVHFVHTHITTLFLLSNTHTHTYTLTHHSF